MTTTSELPPLMQQTIDRMKRLGQLPADFQPHRVENTDLQLSELLDREALFRFAYVPFVIAELVWDYADTIRNLTVILRIRELRKLNRAVSELHREYDRRRARFIDGHHHASEQENMLVFEDGVKSIFRLYITNLRCDLRREYPDLAEGYIDLLEATYQCLLLLRSLYAYTDDQMLKIQRRLKRQIGRILPPELYALEHLIVAYIGDKPISSQFRTQQKTYVKTISNQIALIALNGL